MGKLERKLDEDLIDRMEAGWTPSARTAPVKKSKPTRELSSYRAARRNAARGTVWRGAPSAYLSSPAVRLNRSKKWDGTKPVRSYAACPVGL